MKFDIFLHMKPTVEMNNVYWYKLFLVRFLVKLSIYTTNIWVSYVYLQS